MTNVSWMWHTSYIFTTLQGSVTDGATPKNFVAETGTNTNYKTVSLNLPQPVKISSAKSTTIALTLDIEKVLTGIDLITTPTIGASQSTIMAKLATNFSGALTGNSAK